MNQNEIMVAAFISPTNEIRQLAKSIIGETNFIQIFIDTPLDVCPQRDVKGLYEKAQQGDIPDFTGISSRFEPPDDADIVAETLHQSDTGIAEVIFKQIQKKALRWNDNCLQIFTDYKIVLLYNINY